LYNLSDTKILEPKYKQQCQILILPAEGKTEEIYGDYLFTLQSR